MSLRGQRPYARRSWPLSDLRCQPSTQLLQGVHFFTIVYEMSKRDSLGNFELMVLLAVIRLGDMAYGGHHFT